MCIIIDTNVAGQFIPPSEDAKPILKKIKDGSLKIVCGYKLKKELIKTPFRSLYKALLFAGQIREYTENEIVSELNAMTQACLKSNDAHIIGLARVSGARILFSSDKNLHADFKNRTIIGGERGKIYQTRDHNKVLSEGKCSCG